MEQQAILERITQLKSNMQDWWHKFSDHDFELPRKKLHNASDVVKEKIQEFTQTDDETHQIKIDNYEYESHYPDEEDLPLTLTKESEPGVHFYDTENSPVSRGRPKSIPRGIDKFDDEEEEVLEEDIRRKTPVRRKKAAIKKRHLH